jgi:predicted AAA+ superfamily ATPase
MLERHASKTLLRYANGFPLICITGPRQSGKTTLAQMTFPGKPYLSLEDPDVMLLAQRDPRGLLENYPDGLILDEVQYVPSIFTYLKTSIDKNPAPGKYVVTGSQQFHLSEKITESLAGRAAFLTLLPFAVSELQSKKPRDPFELILKGLYPPLYNRNVTPYDWYTAYITTYIERDVRTVINVKDLSAFRVFLKMCASRIGQLVNLNALAQDCGISHNTAKSWISVLETSGIIFLLQPYYRNYGKRLVKTPKLYFTDCAIASRLLAIQSREQLFLHPLRGNLFESFIVAEMIKARFNAGKTSDLYFWRDNTGTEIDAVQEDGETLYGIEIKSAKTISPDFFTGLQRWMSFSSALAEQCRVVYAGDIDMTHQGIAVCSWNTFLSCVVYAGKVTKQKARLI